MFRLQLISLLSVLSLLSVPVLAQDAVEDAQAAAEQAQESARSAQEATGGNASVSGSSRVSTESRTTTTTTSASTIRTTTLDGLDCADLTAQYEAQAQNYTETTETIADLLTKFESYVEETLAVSRDNEELLSTYTAYNFNKVEYESAGVRTRTNYDLMSELECNADRDIYAGELAATLDVQAEQASTYSAALDSLETVYNSLN